MKEIVAKLKEIKTENYALKSVMHPEVATQYFLEGFFSDYRNFSENEIIDLLTMEIEDALTANKQLKEGK